MDELIVFSQATLGYTVNNIPRALLHIDALTLYKGQWSLLYGPSGSGKTTLLGAVAGYGTILSGEVTISFNHYESAYMPQLSCVLEGMSVRDNITMLSRMCGKKNCDPEHIDALVEAFELTCGLDQSIAGLSGGERMKVALLRSLLIEPKVFFLDEPSCHWDAATTRIVMHALKHYQREKNMSIIMVSHDVDLMRYSDVHLDVRQYQPLA